MKNKKIFLMLFGMIFLIGILGSVSATAPSVNGTVAYYPFQQTSGAVQDLTNNHNGTISGTVTRGVTGIYQNGFQFDGSTGYVNPGFNFNGASTDWTISFWVKPSGTGDYTFFSTDISNTAPRGFQIQEISGSLSIFDGNSGHTGTTSIGSGSFVYLTLVKHSTVTEVYKNGVWSENLSTSYNSVSKPLIIGQRSTSNPGNFYNGVMDEVSINNVSWTASQVSYEYNSGSPGGGQQYPYQGLSITPTYPTNNSYINNSSPNFNATITNAGVTVTGTTFNLYYSNGTLINHQSKSYSTTSSFNESYTDGTLTEGTYKYNINAQSASQNVTTGNITFTIDTHPPVINTPSPTGTYNYLYTGKNLTLNTTISDNFAISSAWYSYNGTNHTISVTNGTLYSQNISYQRGVNNLIVYANDSAGNLASQVTNWGYKALESKISYTSPALAGTSNTYSLLIKLNSSYNVGSGFLEWNGTEYSGTLTTINSSYLNISKSLNMPIVSSSKTVSFYWSILFGDNTRGNSTSKNQTITPFLIDDCSTYSHTLLNYTLYDEDTLQKITNTTKYNFTMDTNILFYPTSSTQNLLFNYSHTYYGNNAPICSSADIGGSKYYVSTRMSYSAPTGYTQKEEYDMQAHQISSSSIPMNISLYALNASEGQSFQLTYEDSFLNPVAGALVQIQRYYPNLNGGSYITVQAPVTDNFGNTNVFLIPSTTEYSILVSKNGKSLSTYNNYYAFCQNPTLSACTISLNALTSTTDITNFYEYKNVTYSTSQTPNSFTVSFSTIDGSTRSFVLNATLLNGADNVSVCSNSISTSTGTLTCTIPTTYQNSTLLLQFYSDGSRIFVKTINTAKGLSQFLGNDAYLFAFFALLVIPPLFVSSTIGMVIASGLGLTFVLGSLFISGGGLLATGGAFIWFVIVAFIIIWRTGKSPSAS